MGDVLYAMKAVHEALGDTACEVRLEEARQKTASLEKFNGQKWLGKLPLQVARTALNLLKKTRKQALTMLENKVPRRCTASSCTYPIYTQYGLICASRLADREEAGLPLEKSDVHKAYYLDRNLSDINPLLTILSPKKVTATKGRPRDIATFTADKDGIFESRKKAIMGKKTKPTTTSLGSRAGDKTRATMASV